MPLYDYQCDTCGHRFEVRQGIREDALTTCPQCGSPIRRVIYPVGIVFKGSGFYINDSRNSSSTTQPAKDGADGAADGNKADKKEGAASGSTEGAPAASGDKAATATASAGDGAKSASAPSPAAAGTGGSSS